MAQWLGLRAANARGMGLIPGWGTKIPPATCGVTKRQKNKIKTVTIQQIFTTHLLHARCGTRQWQHTRARQFPHHWNLRSTHSVQFSCSAVSSSLQPHGLQHTRPPCPSPTPRVYSNSCPLSQWCHPTISACRPLPLLPSIFPSIRVFSSDSVLHIRWPKYWSFSFSISPSNEHSGLISFRMDWLDLLAVQGTLKSLLQHHSSKASILWRSVFFIVQLSHPYMTTGKTTALTRQTFVDKVMSLLFNMLSTLVIAFLPRSKHLLISWLQWFWSPRKYSVTVSIVSIENKLSLLYMIQITSHRTCFLPSFHVTTLICHHVLIKTVYTCSLCSLPFSVSQW